MNDDKMIMSNDESKDTTIMSHHGRKCTTVAIVLALAISVLIAFDGPAAETKPARPNIVLIMADDKY